MIANQAEPDAIGRLELGGDYDVEPPDLEDRYSVTIDDGAEVSA